MKRLTKYGNTSHENGVCCTHFMSRECLEVNGNCANGCKWEEEVWSKLAHYEDLEEQGKLIELPYKVGEWVCCIEEDDFSRYLFLAMCGEYCIVSPHYVHCDNINEQLEEMEERTEECGYVDVSVFHKDKVFLTKEAAEAKIKEMEEKEN